jgi:spermidine/putrescine-binding protein
MHARSLVAATAILVLSCGVAGARDLTVVARPPTQEAIKEVFVRPFTAATAIPVQMEVWEGGIDTLRTQAKAPDNTWDLVLVDSDELASGCSEGLFEKLDWSAIGGKDHYLPQAVSDCGVGAGVATTVLVWDRDKFPAVPSWGSSGCREVSGQVPRADRRATGVRPVRRRSFARRRLQGPCHVRGRRSRLSPAGSTQAIHRVVER